MNRVADITAVGRTAAQDSDWLDLVRSDDVTAYRAWLALLAGKVSADRGHLLLGPSDRGPFRQVADLPVGTQPPPPLAETMDHAVGERRPVVKSGFVVDKITCSAIAVPIVLDGALRGVVVLSWPTRATADLRAVAQEIEWALPAVHTRLLLAERRETEGGASRAGAALDVLAAALDEPRYRVAASAAVSDIADRLGCDRVSLGVRRARRTRVAALSHSGGFSRKAELIQRICDAMDEAIDQRIVLVWPDDAKDRLTVSAAHRALNSAGSDRAILTIPLSRGDKITGALLLERGGAHPFEEEDVRLVQTVAGFIGPVLEERRLVDRPWPLKILAAARSTVVTLFGPSRPALKLALLVLAAALIFAQITMVPLRIVAEARIEGAQRRVIAAPLDGYVASATVRPGDVVSEGEVLATLDSRDLELELIRWETIRSERQQEYESALSERDRALIGIVAAQIGQVDADIALLEEQIERTSLEAPFDGVILSGDAEQSVGSPIVRGDVLYEIAPLNDVRVTLAVDERDVSEITTGLPGEMVLAALPGEAYAIETGRVTSVAEIVDGANTFRAEAELRDPASELRPGMQGIAKITVGEAPLLSRLTRNVGAWLRLAVWRWLP